MGTELADKSGAHKNWLVEFLDGLPYPGGGEGEGRERLEVSTVVCRPMWDLLIDKSWRAAYGNLPRQIQQPQGSGDLVPMEPLSCGARQGPARDGSPTQSHDGGWWDKGCSGSSKQFSS